MNIHRVVTQVFDLGQGSPSFGWPKPTIPRQPLNHLFPKSGECLVPFVLGFWLFVGFFLFFPKMPIFPAVVTSTYQVTNAKAVPVKRQVSGRSHPKTCQRDQLSPAHPTTPKGQTTNTLEPTMLHCHTTPCTSQHMTRGHDIRPVNTPKRSPQYTASKHSRNIATRPVSAERLATSGCRHTATPTLRH